VASYELAEDKINVVQHAARLGIPAPQMQPVRDRSDLLSFAKDCGWPVVVKTHVGNSAKGVRIAHNGDELDKYFWELVTQFALPPERWPFLEEYLPGRACGVCLLCDRGRVIMAFAEEYLRCKTGTLFGTSTYRHNMPDGQQLIEHASRLVESLHWHGLAHCDFIADRRGQFCIIEVNPRPWGAIWLSVAAGCDFPYIWYALADGQDLPTCMPSSPQAPVRCRWILGDMLAICCLLARGWWSSAGRSLMPRPGTTHDDWAWDDPLPLGFEFIDYSTKMLSAKNVNPAAHGMVR
jgi:predicted ATP-grasp superfamily ATP-dependent carboligase